MRKIFLFIISLAVGAACAKAQADTIFVVGSQFGSFSTVNDSTFQVVCDHPTDDLGQGFSGNGIYKGYFAFDVVGNIFRVDSVLVRGVSQTTLWLTEQQNSIGPVGRGIIYRSPNNSVCVPQIPVGYISNATVAKIQNHNTVNGCGGTGGGGGEPVTGMVSADSVTITPIAQLPASSNAQQAFVELATNADANAQILNAVRILTGVPILSENLGSFTGTTISDNTTIKNALQEMETAHESEVGADLQTLSVAGDQLSISQGNTVTLPPTGITGTLTENVIPVADANGDLTDSELSQIDGKIISTLPFAQQTNGLYRNKCFGGSGFIPSGQTGYIVINTNLDLTTAGTFYFHIKLGTYRYSSSVVGNKPGEIWVSALVTGGNVVNSNASTLGEQPWGKNAVRVGKNAANELVIILGSATTVHGNDHVFTLSTHTTSGNIFCGNEFTYFTTTDLTGYSLITMTNPAISVVAPVLVNRRGSAENSVNNLLILSNNFASPQDRAGIAFRLRTTGIEDATLDQGFTIEGVGAFSNQKAGIVVRSKSTSSFGDNSTESALFAANGRTALGGRPTNTPPDYALEVHNSDAALFLNPHDQTIVETEGLIVADDSADKFYYYDGVQRQYPVWESENPMTSFSITDGTNTTAITNGTTLLMLGTNGIKNTISGAFITQELDFNTLPGASPLDGTFRVPVAPNGGASSSVDIDDLATYINQTAPGDGNGLADGSVTIPDGVVTAINSDGAGITWNADNLDLSAVSLSMNGEPYRANDTIIVNHPAHDFQSALTTGTTYRPWRVPADLDGARIIAINYALATNGSGDVIVQITDGTINTSAGTIPAATGYVDVNGAVTLTAGDKWTPSIFSINGTGHEGLTVQFIIERQ